MKCTQIYFYPNKPQYSICGGVHKLRLSIVFMRIRATQSMVFFYSFHWQYVKSIHEWLLANCRSASACTNQMDIMILITIVARIKSHVHRFWCALLFFYYCTPIVCKAIEVAIIFCHFIRTISSWVCMMILNWHQTFFYTCLYQTVIWPVVFVFVHQYA